MHFTNEITSITVLVSFIDDNKLCQDIIPFKIFEDRDRFIAVPYESEKDRLKHQLPEQLQFKFINGKIHAENDMHHQLVHDIVRELRMLHIV